MERKSVAVSCHVWTAPWPLTLSCIYALCVSRVFIFRVCLCACLCACVCVRACVRVCVCERTYVRTQACIHSFGVIHCDIKPENILLTDPAAESLHLKIIDYGSSAYATDKLTL